MWVNPGSARSPEMITFVQSPSPVILLLNRIHNLAKSHIKIITESLTSDNDVPVAPNRQGEYHDQVQGHGFET